MRRVVSGDKFPSVEIIDVFRMEVDHILNKINSSVTIRSIEKWLNNFDDDDRIAALEILNRLRFVSEDEQFELAEQIVSKVVHRTNAESFFYFCPIAKYGKSSTQFSYYIGKASSYKKLEAAGKASFVIHEADIQNMVFEPNTVVVFYDDFFGSGGSFVKHYTYFLTKVSPDFRNITDVFAACGYYMKIALPKINRVDPRIKVLGDVHESIFGNPPMMFTNEFQITAKRALAKRYSDNRSLFKDRYRNHSLGYNDSEAMIAFPYMPPNNTLPIIWSSNGGWYPLLPRTHDDILNKLNNYRYQLAYAATKIELELPNDFDVFHGLTNIKFIVFGLLRMIKKNISHPQIATYIGIPIHVFNEIMGLAQQMNYIAPDYKLTTEGQMVLDDVLEQVRIFKELKNVDTRIRTVKYIPKKVPRK